MVTEQRLERLTTTSLMVDASLKVHATVGVLSLPEDGTHQAGSAQIRGNVASGMTRDENYNVPRYWWEGV